MWTWTLPSPLPQPDLVRKKFLALMVIIYLLPWKGYRHFAPGAYPSIPSRYSCEYGVVGDAEVTPAGQPLHEVCKAEFKPFSAAGLRQKCSLVHGDKKHKKRG